MVSQVSCRINHVPRKFYARFGGRKEGSFCRPLRREYFCGLYKIGHEKSAKRLSGGERTGCKCFCFCGFGVGEYATLSRRRTRLTHASGNVLVALFSFQAIVGLKKMDLIQAILSDKIQSRVAGGVGLLR